MTWLIYLLTALLVAVSIVAVAERLFFKRALKRQAHTLHYAYKPNIYVNVARREIALWKSRWRKAQNKANCLANLLAQKTRGGG